MTYREGLVHVALTVYVRADSEGENRVVTEIQLGDRSYAPADFLAALIEHAVHEVEDLE
jgi:hypothetical protein